MKILDKLKISAKLGLLLALSALSLVVSIALAASSIHQRMMDDRIATLRSVVEMAHGIAQALEQQAAGSKITREEAIQRFRDYVHSMRFDNGSGYLFVNRMDGVSMANGADPKIEGTNRLGNKDINGKPITGTMIEMMKIAGDGVMTYWFPKPGTTDPLEKTSFIKKFAPWDAILGTGVYTDDIETDFRAALTRLGLGAVLLLAVAIGAALLINRNIAVSLTRLKANMEKLASGDHGVDIIGTDRRDEIGAMARAVEVFKSNAVQMETMRAEQETAERQAERERKQTMAGLADAFEASVRGVVDTVSSAAGEMQTTARSMTGTAEQTRTQSLTVASASQEATGNVQAVATAAEELSASIREIGRQVGQAATIASKAAEEGKSTDAAVQSLAESAQKIGDVVALINEIASQTNLLALNATIEAARAGEAGKGFAVVASEVKTLATQTAKATDDIRAQIATIQAETQRAVEAIRSICTTILEVNTISTSIASAVEQQSAATQEIARNVQQAASGTEDVSKTIAGVTAAASETGTAATQLLGSAGALAKQSEILRGEVDRFLVTVRGA